MFYYTAFQLAKLKLLYAVKQEQGFEKMFLKVQNLELRALLTRSENALLGNSLTSLCRNCDTKHTCKGSY